MQDGNTSFENNLIASDFGKASPPGGQLASTMNQSSVTPQLTSDELYNSLLQEGVKTTRSAKTSPFAPTTISAAAIDNSGRFPLQIIGEDNEDLYGQMQSNWDKAANGILKGLNLATTTFVQGTVGAVYGLGQVITGNGLNSFYNNDLSQTIDKWNNSLETSLPNYYTAREREAKWYEPGSYLFTANFLFDKLIKNAGFSVGALGSGVAIARAISLVPKLMSLTQAGRAAQVGEALEQSLSAVPAVQRGAVFENIINQASQAAKSSAAFTNFGRGSERALVSFLGAATEGGIEALQGLNEFRNNKIAEYTAKYGAPPIGPDLQKINDAAEQLGNTQFGLNIALLTATYYIQLPKIFSSSYANSKTIANTAAENAGNVMFDVSTKTWKRAASPSKLLKAYKAGSLLFSGSEAFEEGAQYAFQEGVNSYYNKAYRGEGASITSSLSDVYNKFITEREGIESIILGGTSGGLQQAKGKISEQGITGTTGRLGRATDEFISQLNQSPQINLKSAKWVEDMKNATARGVNLMYEQEAYIRQGDFLEYRDNEADQAINYLGVRIKHGRYDLVTDEINNLRNTAATSEGLNELKTQGLANEEDTSASYTERLNNFARHAENVKDLYESLNLRYGGMYTTKDGTPERVYSETTIDKMVYAGAKIADYDERIPELADSLSDYGIPIQEALDSVVEKTQPSEEATRDALNAINNLRINPTTGRTVTSDEREELKSNLRDLLEIAVRRKDYVRQYEQIKKSPSQFDALPQPKSETLVTVPQANDVPVDLNIGQTYQLNTPFIRDGNNIFVSPSITPINQTLGGEIETELPSGTSFIPVEEFANYDISPINTNADDVNEAFTNAVSKVVNSARFSSLSQAFEDIPKDVASIQEFVNAQNNKLFTDDIVRELQPIIQHLREKREKLIQAQKALLANKEKLRQLAEQQNQNNIKSTLESLDNKTAEELKKLDKNNDYKKAPLPNFLSKEADYYNLDSPKPHQKRRLSFLSNLAKISGSQKAAKIKVLAITQSNEASYGLQGFIDYIKNDISTSLTSPEERAKYLNPDGTVKVEPIAKVYIIREDGVNYLAGVNGNKLESTTENLISTGVFGVFHSDIQGTYNFSQAEGQQNFSGGYSQEDVEKINQQFQNWRNKILDSTESPIYDIEQVTRGIVLRDEENKPVTATALANENDLTKEDILTVVTGPITIGDISYNFPVGQPILTNGSNVDFLNNRTFSPKEAEDVFKLFRYYSEHIGTPEGKRVSNYLSGILYMRGDGKSNTKIYFTPLGNVNFGLNLEIPLTKESIDANKELIVNYLSNYFVKTNNKYIKPGPFEEAYINNNGEIDFRSHPSYSHFMLSSSLREPFLQTKAIRQMDETDPVIVSRYTTLQSNEFEFVPITVPQEAPKPTNTSVPKTEPQVIAPELKETAIPKGMFGRPNPLGGSSEIAKEEKAVEQAKKPSGMFGRANPLATSSPEADIERRRQEELKPLERWKASLNDESKAREVGTSLSDWNYGVEREIKKIEDKIAKYDAELAALNKKNIPPPDLGEFKLASAITTYSPINVAKELKYIQEKSNFNVEILENIIQTPQGLFAWGSYKDKVIKLYNAAIEGTGYHELFEGVWKEFTSLKEKQSILKEFRGRKGSFVFFDGTQYSAIPYSEATEFQMKETLADEFADYVKTKALPTEGNIIIKWIKNLWNFINSILTGRIQSVDQLFKNIDAAKYKSIPYSPSSPTESYEYKFADLDYPMQHDTIRGIALQVIQEMINPNKENSISLTEFEESDVSISEYYQDVYNRLEKLYTQDIFHPSFNLSEQQLKGYSQYWENLKDDWKNVTSLVTEYLKTFSIVESLNPESHTNKEEVSNRDYMDDAKYFQNDAKNTASRSIKLLVATLSETIFDNRMPNGITADRSASTFLQKQVQYAKIFNNLLYQVANINSFQGKLDKLKELGNKIPNFKRLYDRLTTPSNTNNSNSVLNDWKLQVRWFATISKQTPTVYVQYNNADGTSNTGTRNLDSTIKSIAQGWVDSLKSQAINSPSKLTYQAASGELMLNPSQLRYDVATPSDKATFLSQLQIPFTVDMYNILSKAEQSVFNKAVTGMATALQKRKSDVILDDLQSWDSAGNIQDIAKSFVAAGNDFESSFFSIEGERQTKFVATNAISRWVNDINSASSIEELYKTMPQLEQIKDSVYLNDILFKRKNLFELGYIQGTVDADGKPIKGEISTISQRITQEINQNLNGRYYVLVPADATTQWMMRMENIYSFQDVFTNANDYKNRALQQFLTYYNTEKADWQSLIAEVGEIEANKRAGMFKDLSHNYDMDDERFLTAIEGFINEQVLDQREFLEEYQIIKDNKNNTFTWNNLDNEFISREKLNHKKLNSNQINKILTFRTINYMFNNVELQKVFFGNILEYKDPTKRYKLFMSPREISMYGDARYNSYLNESQNGAGSTTLSNSLLGKHIFSDSLRTVTMQDVKVSSTLNSIDDAYSNTNATDAQAWGTTTSGREIKLKAGYWTQTNEDQYQYQMAVDRQLMEKDGVFKANNVEYPQSLQKHDAKLVEQGSPDEDSYNNVFKPIVSGFANHAGVYSPIVDKDSIVFWSYEAIRNTNFRDHYIKMLNQDISYIIVNSGRKVGAKTADSFYNNDGTVDTSPYNSIIDIPFSAFGLQSDTSSKKESQTRGSQITAMALLNLYDAGVPISEEADVLAKQNIALLNEQTKIGYERFINEIGAVDEGNGYRITDKKKVLDLIKDELFRREVADSIKQQLQLKDDGQLFTAFEALPNYIQIKQILYSYVDKYITSPKVSGAPKVQVSGALMEQYGIKKTKVNGKDVFYSSGLKFYTKEEPWIEVLLPAWMGKKLRKAGIKWNSPEELYNLIANSPDAPQLLSGVGFRIPTQEINSVENFRIKGFLPEDMGDTIVVPEEITTKAGSDFDIDKLNTYLQNIYVDSKKQIRIVPYFGIGEEAKSKLKDWATKDILEDFFSNLAKVDPDALDKVDYNKAEEEGKTWMDKLYRQSIENEYFKNIQQILALKDNFERLVIPNTADTLKANRDLLVSLAPKEFQSTGAKSIINPSFMLDTRHNGQSIKRLVGIAALAQKGTAIAQLSPIVLEFNRIAQLGWREKGFVGSNPNIFLPHNNIEGKPTISKRKDVGGVFITDKISQYINGTVDVFNDAFLAEINFNRKTAGTYLMLERLGIENSTKNPIVTLFMNQPIIREFIKLSDIEKINYLLDTNLVGNVRKKFPAGSKNLASFPKDIVPALKNGIEKFYAKKPLTSEENALQQLVLSEYLKYQVYANHLFTLQQGTNYDTATLNDNYSLYFKELQTSKANTSLWSNAEEYMNNSFIGNQRVALREATAALSDVLQITNPVTQREFNKILSPIAQKFIPLDDKIRLARKLEESLLNYLVQTKSGINNQIHTLLVNKQTALINQLRGIKRQLKGSTDTNIINGNVILNQLIPYIKGNKATGTKNITLAVKAKDIFTKNLYNDSFKQLLANPLTTELANSLITLSFLQSGISNSPISFKDAIPADEYSKIASEAINYLQDESTLRSFVETGAFFRNNSNEEELVDTYYSSDYEFATNKGINQYIQHQKDRGIIPKEANNPLIIWGKPYGSPFINYVLEAETQEDDDINYFFKKAEDEYGEPIIRKIDTGRGYDENRALYIQSNRWGDDFRGQEYYEQIRPSVYNNGYVKTPYEINQKDYWEWVYSNNENSDNLSPEEGTNNKSCD